MLKLLLISVCITLAFSHSLKNENDDNFDLIDADDIPSGFNPTNTKFALMARDIVHRSNWTAVITLGYQKPIKGYPMVTRVSVADSTLNGSSTGDIYFCLSKTEQFYYDLRRKNKLTAFFTNETTQELPVPDVSGNYVYIIGYVAQPTINSTAYINGKSALISRHPSALACLNRSNTLLAKLEIISLVVCDSVTGRHMISSDEFYNVDVDF